MEGSDKKLLEQTARLAKENNKILKGIQRKDRLATGWQVLKWIVIIGILIWTYQTLQPFIESFQSAYQSFQNTAQDVSDLKTKADGLGDLFNFGQ